MKNLHIQAIFRLKFVLILVEAKKELMKIDPKLKKAFEKTGLDPAKCILHHTVRMTRQVDSAFDQALSPVGITGRQLGLLMTLAHNPPLNVNRLAAAIGSNASTVPRAVRPLLRQALIKVETGKDRRERLISITPAGMSLLIKAVPYWAKLQRAIISNLGEKELGDVLGYLNRIGNVSRNRTPS